MGYGNPKIVAKSRKLVDSGFRAATRPPKLARVSRARLTLKVEAARWAVASHSAARPKPFSLPCLSGLKKTEKHRSSDRCPLKPTGEDDIYIYISSSKWPPLGGLDWFGG